MAPKAKSFESETGRKPLAGVDYDPDEPMCQDDHEFFTGTGMSRNQSEIERDEHDEAWQETYNSVRPY